jgi:hypothetical protein
MSARLAVVAWPRAMSAPVMLCFLKASGLPVAGDWTAWGNQVCNPEDIVRDHVDEEKAVRVGGLGYCRGRSRLSRL